MALLQKTTNGYITVNGEITPSNTVYVNSQRDLAAPPINYQGSGSDSYILGATFNSNNPNSQINNMVAQNFVLPAGITGLTEVTLAGTVRHNVDASANTNARGLTISGNNADNVIVGTRANDTINGGGGNDVITGGLGIDVLLGGNSIKSGIAILADATQQASGSDVFIYNSGKELNFQETVVGGEDFNTSSTTVSSTSSTTTLAIEIDEIRFASRAAGDTITIGTNVEQIESIVIGTGTRANVESTASVTVNANTTFDPQLRLQESYLGRLMHGRYTTADTTGRTALNIDASLYDNNELYLLGNAGNNRIVGGQSGNILVGGRGADTLIGGRGSDVFAINAGAEYVAGDVINGGVSGIDSIYVNSRDAIKFNNKVTNIDAIYSGVDANGVAVATNIDASNISITTNGNGVNFGMAFYGNTAVNTVKGTVGEDYFYGFDGRDSIDGNSFETNFGPVPFSTTDTLIIGNNFGRFSDLNLVPPTITSFVDTNDNTLKNIENIRVFGEDGNYVVNVGKQTESFNIFDSTGEDSTVSVIGGQGDSDTLNLDYNSFFIEKNYAYASDAALANIETINIVAGNSLDLSNQTEDFTVFVEDDSFTNNGNSTGLIYTDSQGADTFTGASNGADTVNVTDTTAINDTYFGASGTNNSAIVDTININTTIDGGSLSLNGEGFETINLNNNETNEDFTLNIANFTSSDFERVANLGTIDGNTFSVDFDQLINSGNGNDVVIGNSSDNFFDSGAGNDVLIGNGGVDIFNAGAGADLIDISSSGVFSGSDAYVIQDIESAQNFVYIDAVNDTFDFSANGVDVINNISGNDLDILLRVGALNDDAEIGADGSIGDGGLTTIVGNYDSLTKLFTADATGGDSLIVYDQNTSTSVDTVGIVVLGGQYSLQYDRVAVAVLDPDVQS